MTITVLLMTILPGQNHTVVAEYDTPQACEAAAQAHQKVLTERAGALRLIENQEIKLPTGEEVQSKCTGWGSALPVGVGAKKSSKVLVGSRNWTGRKEAVARLLGRRVAERILAA